MSKITEEEAMKEQFIKIARHHRKYCEGETCDISLYYLRRALSQLGIGLTVDEGREFI